MLVCLIIQYLELIAPSNLLSMPERVLIPVGRFFELFPSAVFGLVIAMNKERLLRFGHKQVLVLCATVLIIIVGLRAMRIIPEPNGYGYQGWFAMSVAMVLLVSAIVVGNLQLNSNVENRINMIGSLSPGIYFAHSLVGHLFPQSLLPEFGAARWMVVLFVSLVVVVTLLKIPCVKKVVQ